MLSPLWIRLFRRFHSSGRWFFGSHWPLRVAQREDALLGARPLFVAPRAAERGVEAAGLERVEQRLGLQRAAAALRADEKRLRALGNRFGVGVDDQPRADLGGVPVAELDHLAELVGRVDVQERKRDRARIERLLRQPQQHRRVLADRIEHHRPLELGDHLAHDVDAFGLERPQVVLRGDGGRRAGATDRQTFESGSGRHSHSVLFDPPIALAGPEKTKAREGIPGLVGLYRVLGGS